jgi:hypothetical protein
LGPCHFHRNKFLLINVSELYNHKKTPAGALRRRGFLDFNWLFPLRREGVNYAYYNTYNN